MEIEITPENVEKKFANAIDYYCIYMPNLLNFYQLFTRRVNNKIASMRICVKRDVTPVLEYNEKWICEIDPALFNQALAIDLYRFINHHCTLRELQGANAFKASTAVCNSPELQQFLKAAPLELAEMARKLIWSRESIEEEIGEKISDEDWYYESVFDILNRKSPQQPQQNQNQDQNQSGSGDDQQQQQSSSSDQDKKDENKNGSGKNDKKDQDDKSKGSSKKDKNGDKGDKDSDSDKQDGDGDGDEEDQDQKSNGKNKDKKDKGSKGQDKDQDQDGDGDEDSDEQSQGGSSDKNDQNDQNQEGEGQGDKDQKSDGKDGKDDQKDQNSQKGGQDGQEGDEEDDSDEQDGEGDSDSKDGDESDQNGNGEKSQREQELDDNANADPSKAPNSTGNPFKDWSSNGDENTEEWGRNQVVDQLIQEAFEHTKTNGWGSLTGDQISQIEIANRRMISITPIIASFAATVRTRKRFATRMRYNKRYGLIFPGYRLDRKSRILFAIDSSGSMSDEDINKGCAILHNFLKKCDIDVAFWDAQMIDPFKFKKNITKIEAPGRGGTDPHCIGEYLDEHQKLHYDGVIIFTDCIWSWEENNLHAPVFIISSEEKYRVPSFVKHHATIQALTHCFD